MKVYEHIRANSIKWGIRQIKEVRYNDKSELVREEMRVIQSAVKQGVVLYNDVGVKVEAVVGLKKGKYASKKVKTVGCVSVEKDAVVLIWRAGGKRKKKKLQFGKKRTKEDALRLVKEFQAGL